ncbi:MAG: serine hydrolase, partial [Verrucomicrobia bacterium]|nr:serine hydrolase [Verrucomicrobiota bacterium]
MDFLKANTGRDGVRELLIVRNGRVVWEGDAVTNVHGVWSVTKSFTSTCLGLLVDDERCSLATLAVSLVPILSTNYNRVTLRHFTTMTSGYRAVGDEPRADGYTHGPSHTPFTPGPQPPFAPRAA